MVPLEERCLNADADVHTNSAPTERLVLLATPLANQVQVFARDVASGLGASPKTLPCRCLRSEGSQLFEQICRLPGVLPHRTEREILAERATTLAALLDGEVTLVELGSGSAEKTQIVIEALLRRRRHLRYVPIDIARTMLEQSSRELLARYPDLDVLAIAAEYDEGLRLVAERVHEPKLYLWLGSNVGNFHRPEAAAFLRRVQAGMAPRDLLLVGIDLRKDRSALERAYDDALGVTARFNKNILARINRQLGGHFDLDAFRHVATYDEGLGRVEMYLVSERRQQVAIDALGITATFARDERVHTEDTYKYSLPEIDQLAAAAELELAAQWLDHQRRFSVNLLARR
ncbi:MAG: L-histidine N(alpha)-methyltransferase [Planctomycetota bacterium]